MEPGQLNEDQAVGLLLLGSCCCLVAVVGFIILFVWLARRKPSPTAPGAPPPGPPSTPTAAATHHLHLSVMAIAFDGFFKDQVLAVLNAPSSTADAVAHRVELVQRSCRALLGIEPQWRAFGYGEKDLGDLTATQDSYLKALEDFRSRSAGPGDGGRLVVLTLILATRAPLKGVDRLDQPAQVRAVLDDRAHLDSANLLGAHLLWSPPDGGLTDTGLHQRFPEMHALSG
ncbi:MAG: DUF1517 domain-containing protein [Myxococcales bacterium]|nr:DUF1517 domain-containing protein [Myxococcales bacterium]